MKIKEAIYFLLKRRPKIKEPVSVTSLNVWNGTWTAPEDGFLRIWARSDGTSDGSWLYIKDNTNDIEVGNLAFDGKSGFRRAISIPVLKGHTYKTQGLSGMSELSFSFYELRGGGYNPCNFNAFSAFRKAVFAV